MEYIIICLAALLTSGLTLFSGFGLGTLLMPVFAVFFPIDLAIGMTAIVHFLNNIFKLYLLGRHADKSVVLRFGIPAIVTALIGAQVLILLSGIEPLFEYDLFSKALIVTPVKFVIAVLMIVFALFEIIPTLDKFSVEKKYLPLGGMLSGFFGGLSGHQGALRSAFLVRCGLTKESFIATGVVIACLVDVSRLLVYTSHFTSEGLSTNLYLLIAATLSAFLGAFIGNKLVKKVTMKGIQAVVSIMLFAIAVGLGSGLI
ncbi:MAG: sulfite exporter TauE/SafE family protein [Ignavibacteria bacterium]|nr:sulfite exporter TauE/SafE family protein [Ignavibacteria bacterium]